MIRFVNKYGWNRHSQNGEDGLLSEILNRLCAVQYPDISGVVAEFGAADGVFCSNTRHLIQSGFSGILIEANKRLSRKMIRSFRNFEYAPGQFIAFYPNQFVTTENINNILPGQLDLLSIDVDGIDYHLWKAYKGDAKIVVIEINSALTPLTELRGDEKLGSSYFSMYNLGLSKGYFLVCHCGNMIFVKNEYRHLFPDLIGDPLKDLKHWFNFYWLNKFGGIRKQEYNSLCRQ